MTATGAAPGRSSSESIRRSAAGDTARPRKYSPVTYSVLALVGLPTDGQGLVVSVEVSEKRGKDGILVAKRLERAVWEHADDHGAFIARPRHAL